MDLVLRSNAMTIKWNLVQIMLEKGVKPAQLVERTELHPNTVSKLRRSSKMPSRLDSETLDRLCKALDCTPGDLMTYEPNTDEGDRDDQQ